MYRQPVLQRVATRTGRRSGQGQLVPAPVLPILRRTGGTYLGEDERYYYWMEPGATDQLGGFFDNMGNMFKRMVKFTPKSFTPGNIYKGFVNTTLTVASAGTYQLLPKNLKKTVYEVGKVAIPVIAGGVLAMTMGPAIMSTLMPKLTAAGKLLGGASGVMGGGGGVTPQDYGSLIREGGSAAEVRPGVFAEGGGVDRALTIGGELMNLLGRLPQNKQAEVIQQLTPEDIAYMEQYKAVPSHLKGYFDAMAQQTFNPPMASSGSADLYNPFAMQTPETAPAEAGFFGGMDWRTVLLIAIPVGFLAFMGTGSRK